MKVVHEADEDTKWVARAKIFTTMGWQVLVDRWLLFMAIFVSFLIPINHFLVTLLILMAVYVALSWLRMRAMAREINFPVPSL